jgi:hypothetical protein
VTSHVPTHWGKGFPRPLPSSLALHLPLARGCFRCTAFPLALAFLRWRGVFFSRPDLIISAFFSLLQANPQQNGHPHQFIAEPHFVEHLPAEVDNFSVGIYAAVRKFETLFQLWVFFAMHFSNRCTFGCGRWPGRLGFSIPDPDRWCGA